MTPKQPTPQTPPQPEPFDTADPAQGNTPSAPGAGSPPWQLLAGAKPLPEYELVRKLGEGGFGQVWLATGPGELEVALKFIRLGESASATELKAMQVMKGTRQAHLLALFGVWEKDGWLIVAMELADRSLLDRLKEVRAQKLPGIPPAELLDYMRDAARGLDFLNGKGILHRDVKPHNLFLSGNTVKVADYGLAKVLERTMATASTKMTPAYAAPEFFNGQASKWSDQYCLAVTYCHLRADRLPFQGGVQQMIAGHLMKEPDLSMLPPEERPVVARALAKEPSQRWPSCQAFVEALVSRSGGRPATGPAQPATASWPPADVPLTPHLSPTDELPPPLPPHPQPPSVKGHWLVVLAAVLLLLVAAVIGWPLLTTPTATSTSTGEKKPAIPPKDKEPEKKPDPLPEQPAEKKPEPPPAPKPVLALLPLEPVTLEAGQTVTLRVKISRQHCPGPVELHLDGLPPGITAKEGFIRGDADEGTVEITAAPDLVTRNLTGTLHAKAANAQAQPRSLEVRLTARPRKVRPDLAAAPFTAVRARDQQQQWADYLEQKVETANSIGMKFRLIPPGEFDMGSPDGDKDRDEDEHQHRVRLTQPYFLGTTEVTQEQFEQVLNRNPSRFKDANLPVEQVSWFDCIEFCNKLSERDGKRPCYRLSNVERNEDGSIKNAQVERLTGGTGYRLPTEAEWEYACRAGTATRFGFGDDEAQLGDYAWYGSNSGSKTHPVGEKKPNAFGLYDMHGNVWEWCQDWYKEDYYKDSPTADPVNEQVNTFRVLRGGSWDNDAWGSRAANRYGLEPVYRNFLIGFRVVLVPARTP